jgi:ADP-ribosylglycohydrolase
MTNNSEIQKPKPKISKPSRYRGCLLGGAVGDSLGAPVEFMTRLEIQAEYGPDGIKDFGTVYGRVGAITDDTQMTLFTAEGLLRAFTRGHTRGLCHVPSVVHHAYVQWLNTQGEKSKSHFNASDTGRLHSIPELRSRRAPGNSCLSALKKSKIGTIDNPINDIKGCGGIMRVAPVGLMYDNNPKTAFDMGCEIAAITHGHPTGYLAAGMLASIISCIMAGQPLALAIKNSTDILRTKRDSEECLLAIDAARKSFESSTPSVDTIERLGAGWTAEESLSISLFCALHGQNNFKTGVVLAVNHGGDSDSTGAITGNILGALLGKASIPKKWLKELELVDLIESLANDLSVKYYDSDEWREKYPGW